MARALKKDSEIIDLLRELMRRRGRLKAQLAADLGVGHPAVYRWLTGMDVPTPASCRKIAVAVDRTEYRLEWCNHCRSVGTADLRRYLGIDRFHDISEQRIASLANVEIRAEVVAKNMRVDPSPSEIISRRRRMFYGRVHDSPMGR